MIEKIQNSWKLAKECWRVLMLDKEMLTFPVLSTITSVFILGILYFFMVPSFEYDEANVVQIQLTQIFSLSAFLKYGLLTIVSSYLVYVIVTFFNTGLVTCAFIRLRGGDPIVTDGLQIALNRLPQILTWSVIAASVGLLLRMIKGRNNFLRSLLGGLFDLGWRVASFFVIPVIVAEKKGAVDALKRSGHLVKKNWGEALTLEVGVSVLAIPALIPTFLLFGLSSQLYDALPVLAIFLATTAAAYTFIAIIMFSTLDTIAKAALYMLSSGSPGLLDFDSELLETMIQQNNPENTAFA